MAPWQCVKARYYQKNSQTTHLLYFIGNIEESVRIAPLAPCNRVPITYLDQSTLVVDPLFYTGSNKGEVAGFLCDAHFLIPPAKDAPTFSIQNQKENLMLSTVVFCATAMFCAAEPAGQPQPAVMSQAVSQTQAPIPTEAQNTKPQQLKTATAPEKKSEPQVRVTYRLPTDPPRMEPKSEQKTEPKFELLAIEQGIVDNTNAERARYGRPAFVVDANLMATARQHCTWMTNYRQLVHTNIGVAENIAMGQSSSQDVVRTWMNSSGHRANILNGGHRRIGVAAFRTPEGTIYWCQQFTP